MSWLKSSFAAYAQDALSQAQASIDKALEIEPEQDPLAGTSATAIKKPRTPPTRRSDKAVADWTTWGTNTVNTLWEGSFTGNQLETSKTPTAESTRKKSNALKLGGQRKTQSPTKRSTRKPNPNLAISSLSFSAQLKEPTIRHSNNANDPVADTKPMDTGNDIPHGIISKALESEAGLPLEQTWKAAEAEKEPATPTLSSCSSSSALSQNTLMKSTSSNNSDQFMNQSSDTVTSEKSTVLANTGNEGIQEESTLPSPEREGWSDDDDLDIDKTSSDQDSRESFEITEHKRCLSIGSTASSSILMLQSPYDTTESNGDKSDDKSDEDSMRTPTDLPFPTGISTKLELTQQTIKEEVAVKPVTDILKSKPARLITSPTHSEQSDLIVISEDNASPSNVEMTKLKEILHAREQRLFKMNQEYVEIQDELQSERQKKYDLEQNLTILSQKHTYTVEKFQDELGAVEDLKNHIEEELQTLKSLGDIEELVKEISEKDQLIQELTMEGEKLAQSSFNSSNNVKKLRQKEKEDEKIIRDQSGKINSLTEEIVQLKSKMTEHQNTGKENERNIAELNTIIKTQSEELQNAKAKLESCEAENVTFKTKLDSYYQQIQVLKEQTLNAESRANQESLSANLKAREEAQEAVQLVKLDSESTIKQLNSQISELREVIARLEQQALWKEQRHRDQIQELHNRVEDADGRNQDLSTSITASTQPLLRQIQLFKESQANQQSNWQKIERSLNEKLDEVRYELSNVELEKRDLSDKLQVAKNKMSVLQTQLENSRSARSELEVSLEVTQSKLQLVEEERRKDAAKSDNIKSQYLKSLDESRAECTELHEELNRSRSVIRDLEHNKSVNDDEDVLIASRSSTPPVEFTSQTHILERSLYGSSTPISPILSNSSFSHSSYGMEKITSQLKQSQSEILAYQEQVRGLTLSKTSLSTEISALSERCSELEQMCSDLPKIRKENKELQTRYHTLLQMYGEKAEEVHELQLDLGDVRDAYKAQIEQLLSKVIK